jgi:hypothetical protein
MAQYADKKSGVLWRERDIRRMGEEQNRFGNGKEGTDRVSQDI